MKIDAHHHFWKFDPVRDAWIDDSMSILQKDFLPSDFIAILEQNLIDGTVAVQADQSDGETEFLLNLGEEHDFIKGVVGWIDLQADDLDMQLEKYGPNVKLKGFRHVAQSEPNDFLARSSIDKGIKELTKAGYTYDILIFPQQLPAAIQLVKQNPNQLFVVDHMAKPLIKDQILSPWDKLIKEIAQYPNVYCKVSGLITEADWSEWKAPDLNYYLDIVFEAFGPERLMYGSDWPVCLLAGNYRQVVSTVKDYCSKLSADEKNMIFGQTAINFYKL